MPACQIIAKLNDKRPRRSMRSFLLLALLVCLEAHHIGLWKKAICRFLPIAGPRRRALGLRKMLGRKNYILS